MKEQKSNWRGEGRVEEVFFFVGPFQRFFFFCFFFFFEFGYHS